MYGAILGDIIGSIYEGHPFKTKEFPLFSDIWQNPVIDPVTGLISRGTSTFTDDTAMTIAVADGMLLFIRDKYPNIISDRDKSKRIKSDDFEEDKLSHLSDYFVKNMVFWGKKYPNVGYGGRFRKWLRYDPKPYNSWGNGSAMRVSPIGWMFEDIETTRKIAAIQSAVSHNHPEGIKGAEAVASAIFLAREGSSKNDIREYVAKEFDYDMNRTCDEIRQTYEFDVSAQGSVPESIIAFLDSEDFEDAIRNAISLGGDTDTMGAMAGSIAEAYYGVSEELKTEAENRIPELMKKTLIQFRDWWM